MDPRDPKIIASGVAALVVAGAVVAGIASGVDRETPTPVAPPAQARRTDIDSVITQPGEIAASEVVVPRGWRVVGPVDYVTDDWETVSVGHEDLDSGTLVMIRVRNRANEPRRLAAWIHYAPPVGE